MFSVIISKQFQICRYQWVEKWISLKQFNDTKEYYNECIIITIKTLWHQVTYIMANGMSTLGQVGSLSTILSELGLIFGKTYPKHICIKLTSSFWASCSTLVDCVSIRMLSPWQAGGSSQICLRLVNQWAFKSKLKRLNLIASQLVGVTGFIYFFQVNVTYCTWNIQYFYI